MESSNSYITEKDDAIIEIMRLLYEDYKLNKLCFGFQNLKYYNQAVELCLKYGFQISNFGIDLDDEYHTSGILFGWDE
jgi:hypothetical protein